MTFNAFSNQEARTRSGERVAEWKEQVQVFFNNDWCRLRTLMMELEEGSWNSDTAEPANIQDKQRSINNQPLPASGNPGMQRNIGTTGGEQQPAVKDRLTQLAEQIERKLQTVNASGK